MAAVLASAALVAGAVPSSSAVLPGSGPGADQPEPSNLQVALALPRGQLRELGTTTELRWMFDRPVVDLTGVAEQPDPSPLVRLDPPVLGSFRWASTRMLVFTPTASLARSTTYRATLNGLRGLDDSVLAKPHVLAFSTPTPQCRVDSAGDAWYEGAVSGDLSIYCDQPVDGPSLASHIRLKFSRSYDDPVIGVGDEDLRLIRTSDPAGAARLEATLARLAAPPVEKTGTVRFTGNEPCPSDLKRTCAVVVATSTVPPDARAEVTFEPGIKALEGPLVSGRQSPSTVTTADTPLIGANRCIELCDPEGGFSLAAAGGPWSPSAFDGKLKVRALGRTNQPVQVFTIPPKYRGVADDELPSELSDPLSLRWTRLRPGGRYQVSVEPDVTNAKGQPLGYRSITTFSLGNYQSYLAMTAGERVVEPRYGDVGVFTRNVREIDQVVRKVKRNELVRIVRAVAQRRGTPPIEPTRLDPERRTLTPARNTDRRSTLALGGADERGVFVVAVRARSFERDAMYADGVPIDAPKVQKKGEPSDPMTSWTTALVQRTDIGVTILQSPVNIVVSATDLSTGQPVKGASVALYSGDDERPYAKGKTDAAGLLDTKPHPDADCARCNVIAIVEGKVGGRTSLSYGQSYWRQDYDDSYYDDLRPQPDSAGTTVATESPATTKPDKAALNRGERLLAGVFTDRGVYKLGETVRVKGIVRVETPSRLLLPKEKASTGVDVVVTDDRGTSVAKRRVALSSTGSFALSFKLPLDGIQGSYFVTVDGRGATAGQTGFVVTAFRRPEFQVDVATDKKAYIRGDLVRPTIDGRYLFGAPMEGREASWVLRGFTTSFDPTEGRPRLASELEGFRFEPACDAGPGCQFEDIELAKSESGTVLDATGHLAAEAQIPVAGTRHRPLEARFEATVTDVNRQTISNRQVSIVHPAEWYAGIRVDDQFVASGGKLAGGVVALTPDGIKRRGESLTVELLRWEWARTRRQSGPEQATVVGDWAVSKIASRPLVTTDKPARFSFDVPRSGFYEVRATGRDARGNWVESGTTAYATGAGFVGWRDPADDSVRLIAQKASYQPGETARVLVQSPWSSAEGLLTIERGNIVSARRFSVRSSATTIEIPVEAVHAPNIFVAVALFKGRTEAPSKGQPDDPGRPQVRTGVVELSIPTVQSKLDVAVTADRSEYRPGDTASVSVAVNDASGKPAAGEVTVWAVDEGVLRLTGYRLPDLVDAMYPSRSLEVESSDSRLRLHAVSVETERDRLKGLNRDEAEAGGGGGVEEGGAEQVRSDFRILAAWQAAVKVGPDGKATVDVKLPESLTAYRVLAVAQSRADRFGGGQAEVRVAKPFQIRPALPRFLNVGDRVEAGAVLDNQTGSAGEATIEIDVPEGAPVVVDGPHRRTVQLPKGPTEIRFPIRATARGPLALTFRGELKPRAAASGAGATTGSSLERDAVRASLPVTITRRLETTTAAGVVRAGGLAAAEQLRVPQDVYPNIGGLDLTASSSALTGLQNGVDQLVEYPYGCLEQRSSRLRVLGMLAGLDRDLPLPGLNTKKSITPIVQNELRRLRDYQTVDGGLAYWPGDEVPNVFLTARVLVLMVDLQRAGFKVPSDVRTRAISYLETLVEQAKERGLWEADADKLGSVVFDDVDGVVSNRAHVLWALAAAGRPEPALNRALFQRRYELSFLEQVHLVEAMSAAKQRGRELTTLRNELQNYVRIESNQAYVQDGGGAVSCDCMSFLLDDPVHNTAAYLSASLRADPADRLAAPMARWLLAQRTSGTWANTIESAYALTALLDYQRTQEAEAPDLLAGVSVGSTKLFEQRFEGRSLDAKTSTTPLEQLAPYDRQVPLSIEASGKGQLHYSLRLSYAPKLETLSALDSGFTVQRQYVPYRGGLGSTTFAAGDLVRVELTVTTAQRRTNVAIEDPLPAGFEALDAQLSSTSQEVLEAAAGTDAGQRSAFAAGVDHTEVRDDRVLLFATVLDPGAFHYTYVARATTPGAFLVPPAQASEMYRPELFGRNATARVTVTPPPLLSAPSATASTAASAPPAAAGSSTSTSNRTSSPPSS